MIEIKNLSKTFTGTDNQIHALKNINLTINPGDIYGIIGMSGAGKSTLVRCINMLERPTEGTVLIDGEDLTTLSPGPLRQMRQKVTMIFQGFNLLQQRTCLQNICLPLEIKGLDKKEAEKKALDLLDTVGLPDKREAYPSQLSGGQQQRIAIARALATDPKILLCDEATSALDPKTTGDILNLLKEINKNLGITMIVITHQMDVIEEICNHVAILDQGQVVEEGLVTDLFSQPQTAIAKELVLPEGVSALASTDTEKLIRIVFDGSANSDVPLIARMAIEENITANIKYAATKSISGKAYGNMILGLPNDEDTIKRSLAFMEKSNIIAKEL